MSSHVLSCPPNVTTSTLPLTLPPPCLVGWFGLLFVQYHFLYTCGAARAAFGLKPKSGLGVVRGTAVVVSHFAWLMERGDGVLLSATSQDRMVARVCVIHCVAGL